MSEQKISRDVAEADFDRILKAARVRINRIKDPKLLELFESYKEDVIDEILAGNITVNEDGFPTVHVSSGDIEGNAITFNRRICGKDLIAEDKHKNLDSNACKYESIGRLTGVAPKVISTLEKGDVELLIAIHALFRWF